MYIPGAEQRAIIESTDPILVVLGGAGTGKTTTAAVATRAHLERCDARRQTEGIGLSARDAAADPPDRVLFLSFSRASVARITDRTRSILGPHRNRVEVTTFHALAWRLLVRFGSVIDLPKPYLLSKAQAMLFTYRDAMQYKDLVPRALEVLQVPAVKSHVQRRWSLIISDEFQDTDDRQYALLERLRGDARLVLLGDPNQCIYANLPDSVGVSPERLERALERPGARGIQLPDASFRDPSGIIPAAAAAIRRREFDGPAIAAARSSGRLQLSYDIEPNREAAAVATAVAELQEEGLSVAVFSHHNDALALLSDQLRRAGVSHEIAGLSESLSSAMDAQVAMLQYAAESEPWQVVLEHLAIFVTSAVRGKKAPALARQILGEEAGAETLCRRLADLAVRLQGLRPPAALAIAAEAHAAIGLPTKSSAWARATAMLTPMLMTSARVRRGRPDGDQELLSRLGRMVEDRRAGMLTEDTTEAESVVQLMNLHQTKGREADATVVVLRGSDFFGHEKSEPYEEGSRLLYVVFSRARKRIIVLIFGTALEGLVAPLAKLA